MKASFKGPMVAVATFVLATGASSLALAQQHTTENPAAPPAGAAQPAPQQQGAMPQSAGISDQDVQRFAEAQGKVNDIKQEYQGKLQESAQDPQKAMEIQQEAQQEMVQAVQDSGMDVQQYNQIAQLAQYDNELRQRIESQ
ncbi:putative conserved secreted protein [Alloalcanivorax dieselolei B5]|uniref:Putative conserved secreted protein n=1 Tax=Alcanivorax dieselolei (strain DSM 16502 / CGMCC 1.3690 / MCCC 1A00001 / B-5) TaxID=930169 RepID=K0CB13_ALCDB|nr:DUF4168 domain-containing protein [Alloalcanivorax dieselolei]AFT69768.1 putative conserved secreted protein [Alloalcanivorax dieselolei B5]GGJ86858.1 hypothetical protein GCM10007426_14990 [Alloalcanivorax dieselolei]